MKNRILVLFYLWSVVSSQNVTSSQIERRAPMQGCSHTTECRFYPPGADNRVTCCFNPVTHECHSEQGCRPLPREGSGACRSRLSCFKRPVDETKGGFHQGGINPYQGGIAPHPVHGGVGEHQGGHVGGGGGGGKGHQGGAAGHQGGHTGGGGRGGGGSHGGGRHG